MVITTRARYATRALMEIALLNGTRPVGIRSISESQEIPPKYLESLFRQLKAAGIVRSVRGAGGGYILSRDASRITVWDVVAAVESNLAIVECGSDPGACARSTNCVTRELWLEVDQRVGQLLESVSVADLAERHQRRCQNQVLNFTI